MQRSSGFSSDLPGWARPPYGGSSFHSFGPDPHLIARGESWTGELERQNLVLLLSHSFLIFHNRTKHHFCYCRRGPDPSTNLQLHSTITCEQRRPDNSFYFYLRQLKENRSLANTSKVCLNVDLKPPTWRFKKWRWGSDPTFENEMLQDWICSFATLNNWHQACFWISVNMTAYGAPGHKSARCN